MNKYMDKKAVRHIIFTDFPSKSNFPVQLFFQNKPLDINGGRFSTASIHALPINSAKEQKVRTYRDI